MWVVIGISFGADMRDLIPIYANCTCSLDLYKDNCGVWCVDKHDKCLFLQFQLLVGMISWMKTDLYGMVLRRLIVPPILAEWQKVINFS